MVAVLGVCVTLGESLQKQYCILIHRILFVRYKLGMALAMLSQTLDLRAGLNNGSS